MTDDFGTCRDLLKAVVDVVKFLVIVAVGLWASRGVPAAIKRACIRLFQFMTYRRG